MFFTYKYLRDAKSYWKLCLVSIVSIRHLNTLLPCGQGFADMAFMFHLKVKTPLKSVGSLQVCLHISYPTLLKKIISWLILLW